jgi:membrane carboxypeptidase/penicillin-binding protein
MKYWPCIAIFMILEFFWCKLSGSNYFSKEPKNLTIDESIYFSWNVKKLALYNPIRNPKEKQRNVVLQMEKET